MADNYDKLTPAEKCYWNVYTRLRQLSDWSGFTDTQDKTRDAARVWLVNQRGYIWRCAEGKVSGVKSGWNVNNRAARYAQLRNESLNTGSPRNLCQLPTGTNTPGEKA